MATCVWRSVCRCGRGVCGGVQVVDGMLLSVVLGMLFVCYCLSVAVTHNNSVCVIAQVYAAECA